MIADVQVLQSMIDLMVGTERFSYPSRQKEAPKPAEEFAHITLLEEYQIGIPSRIIASQTDEETTYRTISPAKLRFRVGVVDTEGVAAVRIMHGWTTEAMKIRMIETGYGFVSCHPLSNEDAKLEKEWDFRQGFSIEMYVTRTFEEVVSNIAEVRATGRFIHSDDLASIMDALLLTINVNDN